MRLKQIKIMGFRGFNKECPINLDADVVLIYGLNGTGKSSFTEALEWLFFGDISRRKLSPCRSEYQYEEYLRNLFYNGSDNPFVEVEGTLDGEVVKIRKELITEKQSKHFINGDEVDNLSHLPLNMESYSRPMLAQTEISALVNTEQKDRWEQLSYILGQEDLSRLRQHLIDLRNSKKDNAYKESEKEFNGILIDLRKKTDLSSLVSVFENCDRGPIVGSLEEIIKKEGIDVSPGDYSTGIKIKLKRILGGDLTKRVVDLKIGSQADFTSLTDQIKSTFGYLERCISEILEEKVDIEKIDFLKKGKKYAKIPECPFCMTSNLTQKRMDEIDTEINLGDNANKSKEKFYQYMKAINQDFSLSQIKFKMEEILPDSQETKIIAQKLSALDMAGLAGKLQGFEKEMSTFISSSSNDISAQIATYITALENFNFHDNKVVDPAQAKEILLKNFEEVSKSINSLLTKWGVIKEEIVKLFVLSSATQNEEVEKWMLIDKVNGFIRNNEIFMKKKKLIELIDNIQSKLESFEKQEVEKLLTDHSEEIRDYYNRLNPNEKIVFKKIEVREGVRRQARLIAEAYGREINPVTIFSEAHMNSLSLSIYFPQRVDRNDTWGVVMLDDPVQSMDQNHSASLIEILAEFKSKKQIIVLTHSKAFAEDFVNRFDFSEILHYEFYDGGEDGPVIKVRHGKTLDYLEHVKKNYNGDQITRESAGNALRKAIAAVAGEILFKRGRTLTQIRNFDKQGLSKLFDQLERNVIDVQDLGKLKTLVEQSHSGSHTWTVRDATPNGLLQGIKNVKEVYNKYVA